jgi:hypothetical protein
MNVAAAPPRDDAYDELRVGFTASVSRAGEDGRGLVIRCTFSGR